MRHVFWHAISATYSIISFPFRLIGALLYVLLHFVLTNKEDRIFAERMEDIMIAGHGNPAAGSWLARQYINQMREERREK